MPAVHFGFVLGICRRVAILWFANRRLAQEPTFVSPEHAGCHHGLTECG